ncbi:cell surface glycoprotein 1 [Ceratobasidium sp. AG-Ba]|nr:cell surface glycoprotein 1 [Ceratobasidium sp. AG-Ba]
MEVSPAKSLEVVSDSEGEQDHSRPSELLDQLRFDPNVGILPVSRDWPPYHSTATMSSHNPSSHISQLPPMQSAPSIDSPIQSGSIMPATTPRSRPRPKMRPVPPPDNPDNSIGAFSTMTPNFAPPTDTISSFGNSAVQDVPLARPPSLPPSSLPMAESSLLIPQLNLPTTYAAQEKPASKSNSKANYSASEIPSTTSSNAIESATMSMGLSEPPAQKRARPKMRPPPPPEPSIMTPGTSTTAPSVAATDSSSNLPTNPSTSATSNSAASKTGSAPQRSALDDAEEYTGRGARRIKQLTNLKEEDYVDIGGPEDEIIMLIESSDGEQSAKPKPKPKKKSSAKPTNKSTATGPMSSDGRNHMPSSRALPGPLSHSEHKSPQLQTSDDELGRWDLPIPGEPASTSARVNSKKRKKVAEDSDDGPTRLPAPGPVVPPETPHIPPSSPLSSPGRSPVAKRKEPSSVAEEGPAPAPVKKPRKSTGTMEIVLPTPNEARKKSKAKTKGKGKSTIQDTSAGPSEDRGAYVPAVLSDTAIPSSSNSVPQTSKAATPQAVGNTTDEAAMDIDAAPKEAEVPTMEKKSTKKKPAKGKKGAASAPEGEVAEGTAEAPKKPTKGKGKSKAKDAAAASSNGSGTPPAIPGTTLSNPDASAAVSSSGPSRVDDQEASSSNPSAPIQTPGPKPARPKPRHSTTPAPMPVAMGASGALLQSTGRKSSERPLSETLRLALGGTGSPAPRMGLSRRGSSKIAPLLAMRGVPPPPPPPMPKKPVRKKKGQSDDEDSEEEWEGLTEKQKEKKRREKEMASWYSD